MLDSTPKHGEAFIALHEGIRKVVQTTAVMICKAWKFKGWLWLHAWTPENWLFCTELSCVSEKLVQAAQELAVKTP